MKKESTPSQRLSRRTVFTGAGTVGALAAAAAALPLKPADADAPGAVTQADADADGRYQTTQHVLRYYQTTRV